MKLTIPIILGAISLLLFPVLVSAFYTIEPLCEGDCVSGQNVTWQVTITNGDSEVAEYTQIELRDSVSDGLFGDLDVPYYPLRDDRGDLITIDPGSEVIVNISGAAPKPNGQGELDYYPCFSRAVPQSEDRVYRQSGIYETRYCYTKNETMPLLECTASAHCSETEYCAANTCRSLSCGSCQYIEDNQCKDYECCQDTHCERDQICEENLCEALVCDPIETNVTVTETINKTQVNQTVARMTGQYAVNHTCSPEPCGPGQVLRDHVCVLGDCAPDETIINYTCQSLECAENEVATNNTCVPLDCAPNEGYRNHSCAPLDCAYDEHIVDHRCEALMCLFFQTPEENECRLDSILLIEVVLVALIAFLAILDIRHYKGHYRKKLVSALLLRRKTGSKGSGEKK